MLQTLNQIDQTLTLSLNGSHSLFLDGVAATATQTITWMPVAVVLLYVVIRNNDLRAVGTIVLAIALSILIADQGASSICKPLFGRLRPTHEPSIMYTIDVVNGYRGGKFGFISSHAANTFAVATLLTLLVRGRRLAIVLFGWALLNCWTRVYLGVHYVGDLMCGALWGTLVATGIYFAAKRLCPTLAASNRHYARHAGFTPGGYQCAMVELLELALLTTYFYILFRALFFG